MASFTPLRITVPYKKKIWLRTLETGPHFKNKNLRTTQILTKSIINLKNQIGL